MEEKSYECPCCGQNFTPESGVSPDEYLAKGCIQLLSENQEAYFTQESRHCPRCGLHDLEPELMQNPLSTEYTDGKVYICRRCAEHQKTEKRTVFYDWQFSRNFFTALMGDKCPRFVPELDNPYPLCDNQKCALTFVCQRSAHLENDGGYEN